VNIWHLYFFLQGKTIVFTILRFHSHCEHISLEGDIEWHIWLLSFVLFHNNHCLWFFLKHCLWKIVFSLSKMERFWIINCTIIYFPKTISRSWHHSRSNFSSDMLHTGLGWLRHKNIRAHWILFLGSKFKKLQRKTSQVRIYYLLYLPLHQCFFFKWCWQAMSICLTSSHWLQKCSQIFPSHHIVRSHHIQFAETLLSAGTLIVAICYIPSDLILVGSCQSTFSGWLQVKFSRLEIPTLKFITIYCHKGRYFQPARNMAGLVGEATRLRCGCFDFTAASEKGP